MTGTSLIEPSFADALRAIEAAADLPPRKRIHWLCSLRQIAAAFDKPPESIPARWTSARFAIARLHHARVGSTPKTLANHKSNVRAALAWFGDEAGVPSRGAAFSPAWAALHDRLTDQRTRAKLSSLMRYCSARNIEPVAIDEVVIDGYMRYRAETTALAAGDAACRAIARAWNSCVGRVEGWPSQRLAEPAIKAAEGPRWDEFPEGLRSDIEAYLAGLTRIRRTAKNKRIRPCKPTTIRRVRAELVAAARMAVRHGVQIGDLGSLSALLDPQVVERVIDAYWKADGDIPHTYTIELGAKLHSIARETACLAAADLERLDDIRALLDEHRRFGLTDKNLKLIRQILSGSVWSEVVNLPAALMTEARLLRDHAPVKAAVAAQLTVAIGILSFWPIRLGNLVAIRLDENLIKPGGIATPYMLAFPDYDVKNRVQLECEFDDVLTTLIDEYIHDFRPVLTRGSNEPWLFPGEAGGHKDAKTFSGQITERIEKATGLRMTAHQFRHAAAAIFLRERPGEYEIVRRLLGHRNIQTTMNFYCGLETTQANKMFGDIVRTQMKFEPEPAD